MELNKPYWTSLSTDPSGIPFAFLYEPNDCRNKRPLEIVNASNPTSMHRASSSASANIQLTDAQIRKIGEFAAKAAEKKMKLHIDALNSKLDRMLEALGIGSRENNDNDNVDNDDQALYNYTRLGSSSEHDEPSDAEETNTNEEEAAINEAYKDADVNVEHLCLPRRLQRRQHQTMQKG